MHVPVTQEGTVGKQCRKEHAVCQSKHRTNTQYNIVIYDLFFKNGGIYFWRVQVYSLFLMYNHLVRICYALIGMWNDFFLTYMHNLPIIRPPKAGSYWSVVLIINVLRECVPMKLHDLLTQKRSKILNRWFDLVLDSYPTDTKRFLKKRKDQFANPVGSTISKEIENLYKELLQGLDPERVSPILDRIIRIRAVQDCSPSQATAFIFLLKKVIREELETELQKNECSDELSMFDSSIDELGLLAFDIYMTCREKLYEIRVNGMKNQVYRLLQRANLIAEIPEWRPDPRKGDSKQA